MREADRLLGEGHELPEVFKALEVSEQTYYRWRNQFGGMKADDVKRLKELESENARLKRIRLLTRSLCASTNQIDKTNRRPRTGAGKTGSPACSVGEVNAVAG